MTELAAIVARALQSGLIQRPATVKARTKSQLASVRWHRDRRQRFRASNLTAHGKQFKNSRRTSGRLVHDDIPPKAYRDHTNYMRLWRQKQRQLRQRQLRANMKTHNITITSDDATELRLMLDELRKQEPKTRQPNWNRTSEFGTEATRDIEHKIGALERILKQVK